MTDERINRRTLLAVAATSAFVPATKPRIDRRTFRRPRKPARVKIGHRWSWVVPGHPDVEMTDVVSDFEVSTGRVYFAGGCGPGPTIDYMLSSPEFRWRGWATPDAFPWWAPPGSYWDDEIGWVRPDDDPWSHEGFMKARFAAVVPPLSGFATT